MKKELLIVLCFTFGLFLITNISASIYFSQPDSVYNIGDMISMNVNVSPENSGPLNIVLICDNSSLNVYKGAPTDLIQLPLTTLWMNGLTGNCHFVGYYGGETVTSTTFKISKQLTLNLYTDSFFAKPGDTIIISGNAKKLNGDNINGNVEIGIPTISSTNGTGEKLYGTVTNGEFSVSYTVRPNNPAGNFRIDVSAYEQTENERTSQGYMAANLEVSSVVSNIDIAIETQNTEPGKTVSFKPILSDQSGNSVTGDVAIQIKNSNSGLIFEKIASAGETVLYDVPTNLSSGYYNIIASTDVLTKTKTFFVSEKALVSFEIVNGTLVVTNVGNIPYKKWINVSINGKNFLIKPDSTNGILPGDSKQFKLTGDSAEGNSVKVNDDTTALSQDNVTLPVAKQSGVGPLGYSIAVSNLVNTPIVWIIILVVLALIILFLFRNVFKKKSVTYPAPLKSNTTINTGSDFKVIKLDKKGQEIKNDAMGRILPAETVKRDMERRGFGDRRLSPVMRSEDSPAHKPYSSTRTDPSTNLRAENNSSQSKVATRPETSVAPSVMMIGQKKPEHPSEAEQGLVTDGTRNRAAIIAIKIKNSINKFSKENLEKAIEHVYDKKGAVQEHGSFIFVIYSPVITKSFRNEIDATKDAEKIAEGLKEHNRKFNDKIEFGIGVNSGDIISKIENKKLKFTSLGTLTIAAKKLAELSNGEILMTKEAYEKAMAEVKTEKKTVNGTEVYEVKKVADYDKNKKFINDFLRREHDVRNKSMVPRHSVTPKPAPGFVPESKMNGSNSSNSGSSQTSQQDNALGKMFEL
jgi:hypothetical protein